MFVPGQKVVRKEGQEHNKKWPAAYFDKPLKIESIAGDRVRFSAITYPDLVNPKGWVATRFISAEDPAYNPLKKFF